MIGRMGKLPKSQAPHERLPSSLLTYFWFILLLDLLHQHALGFASYPVFKLSTGLHTISGILLLVSCCSTAHSFYPALPQLQVQTRNPRSPVNPEGLFRKDRRSRGRTTYKTTKEQQTNTEEVNEPSATQERHKSLE